MIRPGLECVEQVGKGPYFDTLRQIAEDCGLNAMRNGPVLQNGDVSHQHSVALGSLLGVHQVLNAQSHCLLVEPPQQLQRRMHLGHKATQQVMTKLYIVCSFWTDRLSDQPLAITCFTGCFQREVHCKRLFANQDLVTHGSNMSCIRKADCLIVVDVTTTG